MIAILSGQVFQYCNWGICYNTVSDTVNWQYDQDNKDKSTNSWSEYKRSTNTVAHNITALKRKHNNKKIHIIINWTLKLLIGEKFAS